MKPATWIIRDEKFYNGLRPDSPSYGQVILASQMLVYTFDMHHSLQNREKIIKQAKRDLITALLKDLMETDTWYEDLYEKDQDRHNRSDGGIGSNG